MQTIQRRRASTLIQATAAQYLKTGRMPALRWRMCEVYAKGTRAMGAALKRELGDVIAFEQSQGGLFFWAKLMGAGGKISDANEFATRVIEKGVAFVSGAPFYASNPDVLTLRLSFAMADVGKIEEGMGRLGMAIGTGELR